MTMMIRSTLNGRTARTVRDAARDPFDWLEGPHIRPLPRVDHMVGITLGVAFVLLLITSVLYLLVKG